MKNLGKVIGRVCFGALAASLIPYRFMMDRETGAYKVDSLLWSVKKTPGETHDHYTLELLPLFGGKETPDEDAAAPVEEPVADVPADEPEAGETASEPAQA